LPVDAIRANRSGTPLTTKRLTLDATPLAIHVDNMTAATPRGDLPHCPCATPIQSRLMATEGMVHMAIENWHDAPQIHPSKVRVGDIIGTLDPTSLRYTVKMISNPATTQKRWTFFGRDDRGLQHTNTFADNDLVRLYDKAS
jgi:hypothetical protein